MQNEKEKSKNQIAKVQLGITLCCPHKTKPFFPLCFFPTQNTRYGMVFNYCYHFFVKTNSEIKGKNTGHGCVVGVRVSEFRRQGGRLMMAKKRRESEA